MKQTDLGLDLVSKKTRKRVFLDEMERAIPWQGLQLLIEPHYPKGLNGRPPFPIEVMLRLHFLQQWFGLSDPAMEEALFDVPLYREFAGLPSGVARLPDESTILRFRHLLEQHGLAAKMMAFVNDLLRDQGLMVKTGTAVDATLISAASSTKNKDRKRDPEMHQTKKGNQWYFGMKAHIGVDAHSGLVHSVTGTAANVHDLSEVDALLHGEEQEAFGDAGYQGAGRRTASKPAQWHIAMRPGKRKKLDKAQPMDALRDALEKVKAGIRAKVEHPFRVIKRQFGYTKVRYRGLAKNTAQLVTLFMLSNVWMVRRRWPAVAG